MGAQAGKIKTGRIRERFFDDRDALAEALASKVADSLDAAALRSRRRGSLVVSGGSTPRPFFRRLRTLELPWRQVDVTLADERWVESTHEASNERFVTSELLQGHAAPARFVPLKTLHGEPEEGADEAAARLASMRPFDVVVLGMGADGHTASLFPDDPSIEIWLTSSALCVAARPASQPQPRLSLTPHAIAGCRRLILHITGEEKLAVYRQAREPGPPAELPIRAFLHGPTDLDVYWAP